MALELRSVTRRFGAQLALDRVSIHVRAGDCYGFIGHNGAGKTTAMRIALGLQRPDEGRVIVDGFDAARFPREARARMGGLIEVPGFYGGASGTDNLIELGRLQGFLREDARHEAAKWIDRVGLAYAGTKAVQNYSHGMKQRLGIAQALLGGPSYVLLDEPTNGLDPEGIAEVRELIRRLVRDEGITFLVSSHQLHELASVCNRIGVLRGGRLLAEEETSNLLGAGGARWRLETDDRAAALRVLAAMGVHGSADAPENDAALWLDLGALAPTQVTRGLVEHGVGVVSFAQRNASLEEIYLRFAHEPSPQPVARRQSIALDAPPRQPTPFGANLAAADSPARARVDAREEPSASALPVLERPESYRAPKFAILRAMNFDLRRFLGSYGLLVLLASPAALGVLAMFRRGAQAAADKGAIGASHLFSATDVNAFEVVGVSLQAGLPLLAFLLLGLGSQSIAAEYARGTLRNALLRPLKRIELAIGKAAALAVAMLAGYAFLVLATLVVARLAFHFDDVAEVLPNGQRFVLTPAADLWPELKRALISPLVPLAAYAAIGYCAGAIVRTGASALALALGFGVVLDLSRALARELGYAGVLPSDYVPSPLSDTSFLRFYVDIAQGVSNATFPHAAYAYYVPAAWAALAFVLAARILIRRPIP